MADDSTTRFSARVANYVRYRPGYPPALVDLLASHGDVVADIGSGTGLLSKPFVDAGYEVIGVEPNREMREASPYEGVDGRAEATTLPDHSVDLIVAGQAFHWFDPEPTRREWIRILRPGGIIALIWNERLGEGAFMEDIERLVNRFAGERDKDGAIREAGKGRIAPFFAPLEFQTAEFPNQQEFDFEGLCGRIFSASYLPLESESLTSGLRLIFDRHQCDGRVTFLYRTKVYWAVTKG